MPLAFYLVDLVMVLTSAAAAFFAWREHRRPVRRWHLLLPGLLATLSSMTVVAYPVLRDLLEVERLALLLFALVAGVLRGSLMGMASDHARGVAAIRSPLDSFVVAMVQVLSATLEFSLDIKHNLASRLDSTVELVLIVAGGYLLGRSLTAWVRAGTLTHIDLRRD
jgi:predicted permease